MGHYIRFINNRDLAVENIMTAYVRTRLVLGSPAGYIGDLLRRLDKSGITLPQHSMLKLAQEVSHPCLPMYTNIYPCVPMCTLAYLYLHSLEL